MNYEIESALSKKAEKWELNSLQQRFNDLQNENRALKREIDSVRSSMQNQYSALAQLLQILIDNNVVEEINQLLTIRQYL